MRQAADAAQRRVSFGSAGGVGASARVSCSASCRSAGSTSASGAACTPVSRLSLPTASATLRTAARAAEHECLSSLERERRASLGLAASTPRARSASPGSSGLPSPRSPRPLSPSLLPITPRQLLHPSPALEAEALGEYGLGGEGGQQQLPFPLSPWLGSVAEEDLPASAHAPTDRRVGQRAQLGCVPSGAASARGSATAAAASAAATARARAIGARAAASAGPRARAASASARVPASPSPLSARGGVRAGAGAAAAATVAAEFNALPIAQPEPAAAVPSADLAAVGLARGEEEAAIAGARQALSVTHSRAAAQELELAILRARLRAAGLSVDVPGLGLSGGGGGGGDEDAQLLANKLIGQGMDARGKAWPARVAPVHTLHTTGALADAQPDDAQPGAHIDDLLAGARAARVEAEAEAAGARAQLADKLARARASAVAERVEAAQRLAELALRAEELEDDARL
ncbi:hypothetical protein T492DRAFT_902857, partial [Pavlovales sp. CCMP2436]